MGKNHNIKTEANTVNKGGMFNAALVYVSAFDKALLKKDTRNYTVSRETVFFGKEFCDLV